jgi:hypothetical protein
MYLSSYALPNSSTYIITDIRKLQHGKGGMTPTRMIASQFNENARVFQTR